MIGRCGRGGNAGLAILFVEPVRRNGKNNVPDFTNHEVQNDDDRMDALAITPVCLRVCFAIDNMLGYIPLSNEDPNVKREIAREVYVRFTPCKCSNCRILTPEAVSRLIHVTQNSFDDSIIDPERIPVIEFNIPFQRVQSEVVYRISKGPLTNCLEDLSKFLVAEFDSYFYRHFDREVTRHRPHKFFNIEYKARAFVTASEDSQPFNILERLIGKEAIDGQIQFFQNCIAKFQSGNHHLEQLENEKIKEQTEAAKKNPTTWTRFFLCSSGVKRQRPTVT
ncbi:hypothetical protein PTTG_10350 [Puccinia triticina 1-1 BBBD Race 1]|uniref:Helicase C-terminal domain-containing protein n=1 Tax=Puccinia triticina (isolate 1-1 / race 1 (BBBD)) TaxID=630390 RepID=A0A180G323_PUCT1|nr:hypothetical protein PTTG_10350 [Puccinia triticina 1-1 BBBD Race 1]